MAKTRWNRDCPLNNISDGSMFFEAERFVPDGTNGATFTDDLGTDAKHQMNVLYFAGAADAYAHLNFVAPRDYFGDATLRLYWFTAKSGTTTTAVTWAGTVRAIAQADLTNIDYSARLQGTLSTSLSEVTSMCPSVGSSISYTDIDLTVSDFIAINPGDYLQVMLFRNVSLTQTNDTRINMLGGELRYTRGGSY